MTKKLTENMLKKLVSRLCEKKDGVKTISKE